MFLYLALYLSGPAFILLTKPQDLPLPILVFPFIWLFVVLFVSVWLLFRTRQLPRKQIVLVSGIVATTLVLLAVFQSIHQLTIRDVLLSLGLVSLAAVYMLRADFIK